MSIVITGATGRYGGFVLESLLARGIGPAHILACGRNQERLAALAARGVRTTRIDHDDPSTLDGVFESGDKILLVPVGSGGDALVDQNRKVLRQIARAGAQVVYPSVTRASEIENPVTYAHARTEQAIADLGVTFTILRNGWFSENYADVVRQAADTGTLATNAIPGRVASAPVRDFAEAAAVVLAGKDHEGKSYELAGDHSWSYPELAQMITEAAGKQVVAQEVTFEQYRAGLIETGMPEFVAELTAGVEDSIRQGWLSQTDATLSRLLDRPTGPMSESVTAFLRQS